MTSIHFQSLNIGQFCKVAHLPDQNPDPDDFKIFCVKGLILPFQVTKSTKTFETTSTFFKYLLFKVEMAQFGAIWAYLTKFK
jgi:hypothetical protein